MHLILLLCCWLPTYAGAALSFKQEAATHSPGLAYAMALIALIAMFFCLKKFNKNKQPKIKKCQIIEQLTLNHKTRVYVIRYDQQHFMIADNPGGLAIQALNEQNINHEH